jgi:zinc transport system substrate-binding protein
MSACAPTQESTQDNKPTIYTSIYPIQYAVERIAGDFVSTKTVYPPGVDAHTYEPTSKEMTNIAKGDAFFYLGAGMEGFAESAADALANQDTKLVELGENESLFDTEVTHHEDDGHHHGDHDPHIWLDPIRMIDMSEMIKEDLVELYPEQKDELNQHFETLKTDLMKLNNQYKTVLQDKKNKEILVSHAAFGYWEERYGITQIAINGLSSSSEPSQKELTKIVDQAKEHQLKYIIFEQNVSNHVSEIIQDHIGAKPLTIHNLSVLTEEDIENDADYLSLMNYNLDILDKATK